MMTGTSYLDILLLHYSNAFLDANEVANLFVSLKADGVVRHFGVSNHSPSKFNLLQKKLDRASNNQIKLVTHEFEASVWNPGYMNYDSAIADHAYENELHPLGEAQRHTDDLCMCDTSPPNPHTPPLAPPLLSPLPLQPGAPSEETLSVASTASSRARATASSRSCAPSSQWARRCTSRTRQSWRSPGS
jgi:hypothetical protein